MKKVIIIIFTCLAVAVVVTYFVVSRETQLQNKENSLEFPKEFGDKIFIKTDSGDVQINNIYKVGGEVFEEGVTFKENPDYYISFSESDHSFSIAIVNPDDLRGSREKAEKEFIITLGITEKEACELDVKLGVPYSADVRLAEKNYGLSFCPDGKDFEEIKGL